MSNAFVVATVIQIEKPTSCQLGDKAIIRDGQIAEGWVGGGCVQPAVVKAATAVQESGQPLLIRVAPDGAWSPVIGVSEYTSHCLGGGSVMLFIEPCENNPTLHIVGGSAVAKSLALMSGHMKLNVVVVGDRNSMVDGPLPIQHTQELNAAQDDYIVIATQGKGDMAAIESALASECRYIKMVVSQAKLDGLKSKLAANGHSTTQVDRLCGPAGLDINAQLPAEVAVSVLADVIKARRSVLAAENSGARSDLTSRAVEQRSVTQEKPSGGCCGG